MRVLFLSPLLLLGACTSGHVDICKNANLTRAGLVASITVTQGVIADKIAHGQSPSPLIYDGLRTAQAALTVLNTTCPVG